MPSQHPHPVDIPLTHEHPRNNLFGRRLEKRYQQDLAQYGPEIAEDMHGKRLKQGRQWVPLQHLLSFECTDITKSCSNWSNSLLELLS
jgi:hypothetical protein